MQYTKIGFFAFLLQSTVLFAQNDSDCDYTRQWWLNIGAGVGTVSNNHDSDLNGDLATHLSFNGMITKNLFMTLEWTGIVKDHNYYRSEEAREFGLLLGFISKRPSWYWSAATGIGASRYEKQYIRYSNYNYFSSYTVTEGGTEFAVPVEGQLFWTPFKHFGVGVIGHVAVSKNPIATAMLAIQFA